MNRWSLSVKLPTTLEKSKEVPAKDPPCNTKVTRMETALEEWIADCQKKNISLDTNIIRKKAKSLYDDIDAAWSDDDENEDDQQLGASGYTTRSKDSFIATLDWFHKFQKRLYSENYSLPTDSGDPTNNACTDDEMECENEVYIESVYTESPQVDEDIKEVVIKHEQIEEEPTNEEVMHIEDNSSAVNKKAVTNGRSRIGSEDAKVLEFYRTAQNMKKLLSEVVSDPLKREGFNLVVDGLSKIVIN